jgi:hypothetical protein
MSDTLDREATPEEIEEVERLLKASGKTDFCWLVFDRAHSGPPELWWLHRDDPR